MDGFIIFDKPAGMTSHDVVSAVRRVTGQKKVGHTGTLDPFATGVLPVAVGEGTKAIQFLDESVKEYRGVIRFGVETDTDDRTGVVVREREWRSVSPAELREVASHFVGRQAQIPPMYSALKRGGVPLYKLARKGRTVEREARQVEIFLFDVEEVSLPDVSFRVRCSRGTYVRALARDMGERLGCGAHLVELRRTVSGPFAVGRAVSLDRFTTLARSGMLGPEIISTHASLSHLRDLSLSVTGAAKVTRGIVPGVDDFASPPILPGASGELVRLSFEGTLVAVAEIRYGDITDAAGKLHLLRVFNELYPLHDREVVVNKQDTVFNVSGLDRL